MLVALLIGMAIVLPSLFYLFRVFKWTPIVTPEETQAQ
jgi:cytochrome bd-type quinol oxidase subunit 2